MNSDRLRLDLASLAEEATPVDLRDRALKTSRRLRIQRAVATSAAALVMLGAAAGTAYGLIPRNDRVPAPAATPSVSISPSVEATPTPTPSAMVARSASSQLPDRVGGLAPGIYYYVRADNNAGKKLPGQLWHKSPDGKWQAISTTANDSIDFVKVPSPDGRLLAWFDKSSQPNRLRVSNLDGSRPRTLATLTDVTCLKPWWTGGSGRLVFGTTDQRHVKIEAINVDGTNREVVDSDGTCDGVAASGDGSSVAYPRDGRVVVRTAGAGKRTLTPQIASGLVVNDVSAISPDGRRALIGTHTPTPGECGCGWQIRNFLIDLATGSAVELAPLEAARNPGTGSIERAALLSSGEVIAQIDTANLGGDTPQYRLGTFSADGRLVGTSEVPPGSPYGFLVTYQP